MAETFSSASRRVGRYELCSYLGSGGMSDVYVALHTGLRKRVALKLLRPLLRHDTHAVQRFLREGECAARVCHPNVVDVSDVGIESGIPFLVMELLEGETLADKLERHGPMTRECAIDLLLPILDAVSAAHAAGVLHRDIKPGNILLARANDGTALPKLVDFGIATCAEYEREAAPGLLGTPHYMSPEQARGERVDENSDQYSLASVLFEMLVGRPPFRGDSVDEVIASVARARFPRASSFQPALPAAFDEVLTRATAKLPAQRYESVHAFASALVPFASASTRVAWCARYERSQEAGMERVTDHAERATATESTGDGRAYGVAPRSFLRSLASTLQRAAFGAALLGLGVAAGLGVTPGEAEAPERPAPTLRTLPAAAETQSLAGASEQMVRLVPRQAKAVLDGIPLGGDEIALPKLSDELHELRVSAPHHIARVLLFRGALPDRTIVLEPVQR